MPFRTFLQAIAWPGRSPSFCAALIGGLTIGVLTIGGTVAADEPPSIDPPPSELVPSDQQPASGAATAAPMKPWTQEQEAMFAEYLELRKQWAQTLLEMKKIQIRHNNSIDKSSKSMDRFYELRNQSRGELRDLYNLAEKIFAAVPNDFETASFVATVLDYRRVKSDYDGGYRSAKMLLDAGVPMPYLEQLTARAAFIDGKFDEVIPLYQTFVDANGPEKLDKIDQQLAGMVDLYPPLWEEELKRRQEDEAAGNLPRVVFETTSGPVVLELFEDQAPNTVANFIRLVEDGFYDETEFYQVIDDLLAMGGDPTGVGTGTSGKFIPDEHERPGMRGIFRGSIMMAKVPAGENSGEFVPDSASSQFVIALMPILPKKQHQTVFGRVVEGMDVVGSFRRVDPTKKKEQQVILPPDRIITAKVLRKRDHDYSVEYTR